MKTRINYVEPIIEDFDNKKDFDLALQEYNEDLLNFEEYDAMVQRQEIFND